MYSVTITQTRPDLETKFFDIRNNILVTEEYRNYWRLTYVTSGMCQFVQHTLSEDELVRTSVQLWTTKEAQDQFLADPVSLSGFLLKFEDYNTENGILTTRAEEDLP